ncbi:MAG: exo-beta-N-acetylmuramidase NamZ domain-containing protein [Sphingobacteriia bacterium]|jgi:uncharacterized protein YbbC (DUF1343 family)
MRYSSLLLLVVCVPGCSTPARLAGTTVRTGAQLLLAHPEELKGKRLALVANHTSLVEGTHLVDTLLVMGHTIQRVFAPEHGFRGGEEAGAQVQDARDRKTHLPIVSLYGKQLRPTRQQLQDVDLVVFDIQDVGCRFYTYLSTLVYVMDACAEYGVPLLVLDRPNPNGHWVGGPGMEAAHTSFVGVHPGVPMVHGMTLAEYARLVNGEGWLPHGRCILSVVACDGYTHRMRWQQTGLPWVPPSPNLPTPTAAELYPILCWYEGTVVSVGRGTDRPFQQIGMPGHRALLKRAMEDSLNGTRNAMQFMGLQAYATYFTPVSQPGRAAHPPYEGQRCYGLRIDTVSVSGDSLMQAGLKMLVNFYQEYEAWRKQQGLATPFFTPFFENLVGSSSLRRALIQGDTPEAIGLSWQKELRRFENLRRRYLLYAA